MNAVLDILIIGILIFCVAMGYKNGFVKTVMSVLCFVLSFIAAKIFAPGLADLINSNWIMPNFADKAAEQLRKLLPSSGGLDKLIQDQPSDFLNILKRYGLDVNKWLAEAAQKAGNEVDKAARNIVEAVAGGISYFLAFTAILLVAFVLLKIASALIEKAVKLPGLNLINRTGGILLGLLYGVVICYIFVYLSYYVLPYFAANAVIGSALDTIENTIFFKWFLEHPITDLLRPEIDYLINLNSLT